MKSWTEKEVSILKDNYNKLRNDELYKLFPEKTPYAIYKKAYSLGLRKQREIEFQNRSYVRKGERAANWKGGTRKTRKGYRQILMPQHKRADPYGYVFEHIVVFEKETGMEIPDGYCVHHLNGVKSDNRIENLCLMTHSAHTIFHHKGRKHSEQTKKKISERKKKHE